MKTVARVAQDEDEAGRGRGAPVKPNCARAIQDQKLDMIGLDEKVEQALRERFLSNRQTQQARGDAPIGQEGSPATPQFGS